MCSQEVWDFVPVLYLKSYVDTRILGESWSPRSVDTPVSTGKTTTSALRDQPRTLSTEELKSSLGQDLSGFYLHPGADPVPQLCIPKIPPGEKWSPRSTDTQACRESKP